MNLPSSVTVGAILRGDAVLIAHDHVVIEADDHVILFLTDRTQICSRKIVCGGIRLHLMQFAMAFKIIGVLLILFSTAMLPSLLLSLIAKDGIESAFATGSPPRCLPALCCGCRRGT